MFKKIKNRFKLMKKITLIQKSIKLNELLFHIHLNNKKIGITVLEYSNIPNIYIHIKKKYRNYGYGTSVIILLSDFIIINKCFKQLIHIYLNKISSLLELFLKNDLIKYCGKGHYLYNHTILKSYLLRLYVFYRYNIIF